VILDVEHRVCERAIHQSRASNRVLDLPPDRQPRSSLLASLTSAGRTDSPRSRRGGSR
jgi:hypothetical protein